MKEIWKLLYKSDEYLLGRIHNKASNEELEEIIRYRLKQ